ncbi:MAG: hypothetical protein EXX96DRAFT_638321 [Benjaminiella poitrasii]|nr:MAG: hypothetical protein EXX96DRAFT_638321 [Benjaminiella poitrasii]
MRARKRQKQGGTEYRSEATPPTRPSTSPLPPDPPDPPDPPATPAPTPQPLSIIAHYNRKCKLSTLLKQDYKNYKNIFRYIAEQHTIVRHDAMNFALFMVLRFFENQQIEIHRNFQENIPLLRDVIRFTTEERNQLNLARRQLQEIQQNPLTETDITLVHENMMTAVAALDQHLISQLQRNQDIFISFQQIIAQTEDFGAPENISYLHTILLYRTIIEKVARSLVATRGILTEVLALQQVLQQIHTQRMEAIYREFPVHTRTIIDTISDHQNNIQQANTLLNRLNRSIESSTNETARAQLLQARGVLLANLRAATERAVGFEAQNQRILQDTIVQVFLDSPNLIRELQDYTTTSNHFIEQCTIIEGRIAV